MSDKIVPMEAEVLEMPSGKKDADKPKDSYGTGTPQKPKKSRVGLLILLGLLVAALCTFGVVTHFFPPVRFLRQGDRELPAKEDDTGSRQIAVDVDGLPEQGPTFDLTLEDAAAREQQMTASEIYAYAAPFVVRVNFGGWYGGNASGIVITRDGLILCAAVDTPDNGYVRVRLDDGREFDGTIVRLFTEENLCLVQIDGADRLSVARFAREDDATIGQTAFSVGYPQYTDAGSAVFEGIVNQRYDTEIGGRDTSVIYCTACLFNDLGSPLLDGAGRVIGISAQIYSEDSDLFQGETFVIGSSFLMELLKSQD